MKNAENHTGMPCPKCRHCGSKIIDSRLHTENTSLARGVEPPFRRRRHVCLGCSHRFTTYEMIYEPKPSETEILLSSIHRHQRQFGVEGDGVYGAMAAYVEVVP